MVVNSPQVTLFPLPPPGFDPLKASPRELDTFGLPRKPDPRIQPAYSRFWTRQFSPPITFTKALFVTAPPPGERSTPARFVASTSHQKSSNWSGAYITPRDGLRFTEIHGAWRVPAVTRPAGAQPTLKHESSTWIGLDGQRRYLHSPLPQIGTGQVVPAGNPAPAPTYGAWWQWWVRDLNLPIETIVLAVNPNDEIMCSLEVLTDTLVKLIITNRTTGVTPQTFMSTSPVVTLPSAGGPVQVQLKVSGATAEWVMERPAPMGTTVPFPLTAYGTVNFTEAIAISAPAPGGTEREENLLGARLIDLYEVRENPHRTTTISLGSRVGPHAVRTTYRP